MLVDLSGNAVRPLPTSLRPARTDACSCSSPLDLSPPSPLSAPAQQTPPASPNSATTSPSSPRPSRPPSRLSRAKARVSKNVVPTSTTRNLAFARPSKLRNGRSSDSRAS